MTLVGRLLIVAMAWMFIVGSIFLIAVVGERDWEGDEGLGRDIAKDRLGDILMGGVLGKEIDRKAPICGRK